MLSPASARKPLTAAISPGRSGQASSRRDVGCSAIRRMMAVAGFRPRPRRKKRFIGKWRWYFAPERCGDPHSVRETCDARSRNWRPESRHGPALAHKTHIHRPCPRSLRARLCRRSARRRDSAAAIGDRRLARAGLDRDAGAAACAELPPHDPHRRQPDPRRTARRARRQRREAFATLPAGVSIGDARLDRRLRVRRRPDRSSPPTAATAASTSSTSAPGNRSAAAATPPRPPRPSRTTARRCSTPQSGSSPWPVCG